MAKAFTEKQLSIARKANMYEYMLNRGEGFKKLGISKFSEHEHHDSMRANRNTGVVTWFSQQAENGVLSSFDNSIEFAMRYFGDPYEQVVQSLIEFNISMVRGKKYEPTTEKKQTVSSKFSMNNLRFKDLKYLTDKGKKYLMHERFLSEETVDLFAAAHLISSDEKNNIIFKWLEVADGIGGRVKEPIGADVQGIYRIPVEKRINYGDLTDSKLARSSFKQIVRGSLYNGGFLFSLAHDLTSEANIYVFEAPIEAISYYELHKDNLAHNAYLLSLSGLKADPIRKLQEELKNLYPKESNINISLCVNNDNPAKEFIKNFHAVYKETPAYHERTKLFLDIPKESGFDWNDALEKKVTGANKSKERERFERLKAEKIRNQLASKGRQELTI